MKNSSSRRILLRIVFSVLPAFFIVMHGRWHLIGEAFVSPSFYFAFLLSSTFAYLLLSLVHFGSIQLDNYYPWDKSFYTRFLLQFIVGLVVPSALDILFAFIYLDAIGSDLESSGFLLFDFPIIVFFILLINIEYYRNWKRNRNNNSSEAKTTFDESSENLTVNYNGDFVKLNMASDILYLYRDGKLVKIQTVTGATYSMHTSISTLMNQVSPTIFCQISRSVIINVLKSKGYSVIKRDNLQARFKTEYHPVIKNREDERFKVTKEYIDNFKKMLDENPS